MEISETKIRLLDFKNFEEMNELGTNKTTLEKR